MIFLFNDPIGQLLGNWSVDLTIWSTLLRIVLSIVLAAIIGWERSSKRHAAGLRTFIIVSLASTLAMIIDLILIKENLLNLELPEAVSYTHLTLPTKLEV